MSTFNGIIAEFPDIRIDHFRRHPGLPLPAACFLSHIHSDHLLGLESLKCPFVYCSAATKRLLLKMEKYPHRINFAKNVLEARKQTYKHLKTILRPLPLNSPVELELNPKVRIKVTLFDANHCPGATMFLIEGDGKAILYTGDIRSEPWWVNAIARQPVMIPYIYGQKHIDCLYLDTTFASHSDIYRTFPTKAEGLAELTQKLMQFPANSIFYFRAWTLGYEDVWAMLSHILDSQIHVDEYQLRLFRSIAEDGPEAEPGPILSGFKIGNADRPGCLTTDPLKARIHSCEPGTPCHSQIKKTKNVVWITPIISRMKDGTEVAEIGAGGGRGDLYQHHEIEVGDKTIIEAIRGMFETINQDPAALKNFSEKIAYALQNGQRLTLEELQLDSLDEISIRDFLTALISKQVSDESNKNTQSVQGPNVIHFPYSRHSSYEELRHLVKVFRPRDICPCTVDLDCWEQDQLSMKSLFGDLCSGNKFKFDRDIEEEIERRRPPDSGASDTQPATKPTQSQVSEDDELDSQQMLHEQVAERATNISLGNPGPMIDQVEALNSLKSLRDRSETRKVAMQRTWQAANGDSDFYFPELANTLTLRENSDNHTESDPMDLDLQLKKFVDMEWLGNGLENTTADYLTAQDGDISTRATAFEAALQYLETGSDVYWSSIRFQSLGRGYHTEKEVEL